MPGRGEAAAAARMGAAARGLGGGPQRGRRALDGPKAPALGVEPLDAPRRVQLVPRDLLARRHVQAHHRRDRRRDLADRVRRLADGVRVEPLGHAAAVDEVVRPLGDDRRAPRVGDALHIDLRAIGPEELDLREGEGRRQHAALALARRGEHKLVVGVPGRRRGAGRRRRPRRRRRRRRGDAAVVRRLARGRRVGVADGRHELDLAPRRDALEAPRRRVALRHVVPGVQLVARHLGRRGEREHDDRGAGADDRLVKPLRRRRAVDEVRRDVRLVRHDAARVGGAQAGDLGPRRVEELDLRKAGARGR